MYNGATVFRCLDDKEAIRRCAVSFFKALLRYRPADYIGLLHYVSSEELNDYPYFIHFGELGGRSNVGMFHKRYLKIMSVICQGKFAFHNSAEIGLFSDTYLDRRDETFDDLPY